MTTTPTISGPKQLERSTSARWALVSLSLSMLIASLGTSIANVALPTLADAFDASFQHVQWVVLAYLLAITTLIVSAGRLGDIIGRRRLLLFGLAVFTGASVLCGSSPSLWLLIAARGVQGLGAAILMALTMAVISETVPNEKTGSAMGLLGTMSAIGTALGPSLGGILIAELGWQAVFYVKVPLGLFSLLLAYRFLPADRGAPEADRPGFDGIGTLLLAATLAAYALSMTMGRGQFGPTNGALMAIALVGLGLFVFVETSVASPLVRMAAFRNRVLSAGLVTNALVSTVMMATLVVGPFFLSEALGLQAAAVGLVMSVGPVVAAVSGVLAGRAVDRLGRAPSLMLGLAVMATASAALALLPAIFGWAGYIAAIVLLTPGYQLFQAANNTAVMHDVSLDQRGTTSGLLNLSRNLGLITGASAMGALFALAAGTSNFAAASPDAVAFGMEVAFGLGTVLILAALVLAVASQAAIKRSSRIY